MGVTEYHFVLLYLSIEIPYLTLGNYCIFSVEVDEAKNVVFDKLTSRIQHITNLRAKTSNFESGKILVSLRLSFALQYSQDLPISRPLYRRLFTGKQLWYWRRLLDAY